MCKVNIYIDICERKCIIETNLTARSISFKKFRPAELNVPFNRQSRIGMFLSCHIDIIYNYTMFSQKLKHLFTNGKVQTSCLQDEANCTLKSAIMIIENFSFHLFQKFLRVPLCELDVLFVLLRSRRVRRALLFRATARRIDYSKEKSNQDNFRH